MGFRAMSQEEMEQEALAPHKKIQEHINDVIKNEGRPIQMPQVVRNSPVAQPVQQPMLKQQPTVTNPQVVPPKKGGCGCWGNK